MNRRVFAGLLALGLIVGLASVAQKKDVPWVTFSPGPTFDVLGADDGKDRVTISGHPVYKDDGELRFVTVYLTPPKGKVGLLEAMLDWVDPDVAVLPRKFVYKPEDTNETARAESALEMTTSQDDATAAALTAAGITYPYRAVVSAVIEGGAADGKLKPGDVIKEVDGKTIATAKAVTTAVSGLRPGSKVTFVVRRDSTTKTVVLTTRPDKDDPKVARINVSVGQQPIFPFKVSINIGDNVGGPSAGMMFALSIYDLLTPGSLTGGKVIAGSGTIDADGVVGAIGGIGQKLVGAQNSGVKLFLVSDENCAEAARSHYDKDKMTLVKVHTLADAIKQVNAWRENPNADLDRCTQ